jgi:hypothetical protein
MNSDGAAIDRLQSRLREASAAALEGLDFADLSVLDAEMPELRAMAAAGTGLEAAEDDRILAAVRAYQHTGVVDNIGQVRSLCYGCTRVVDSKRLIEHPEHFAGLLQSVERYRFNVRPYRRCYRGLLNAYFSYDPDASTAADDGRRSWRDLRTYLQRRRNSIETPGFDPEWVTALLEHRNLLTEDPAARYGMGALGGNAAAFDAIRERLGIGDDSWLMRRLAQAQLDAALALTDAHFKAVVVRLLVSFAKHPVILDRGLAKVLDRYAASATTEVHARLRDFAVKHWGNPTSPVNAARWSGVRAGVGEMVAAWLKMDTASSPGER